VSEELHDDSAAAAAALEAAGYTVAQEHPTLAQEDVIQSVQIEDITVTVGVIAGPQRILTGIFYRQRTSISPERGTIQINAPEEWQPATAARAGGGGCRPARRLPAHAG
jgi:hypothetical protein